MNDTPLIINAVRMLGRVLRLYPKEFRDAFAADMQLTFRDQCRVRYVKYGAAGVIGLWLITAINVTWEAIREHMHSLARLGALAWMIGGVLWVVIHLPFNMGWLPVPMFALLLLIFGLACLLAQVAPSARRVTQIGFLLTGVGQVSILAGYMSALFGWWGQTGVPSVVGMGLQCVGLLLMGLSMRGSSGRRVVWQWMMLALSLINLIYTAWIYLPLRWEYLLHTTEWTLGLISLAMVCGVCWMMLGAALWHGSRTEIGRIA